jgi:nitrogen regulatory protein P-II 1
MNVRGIKAYVHRNRIADVVNALYNAGFKSLTVIDVEGVLKALNTTEQRYSVEIGQKVAKEVKLELVCETENCTARAVALISEHAKTGQPSAGWIYLLQQRLAAMDEQTDRRIDARIQRREVARFDTSRPPRASKTALVFKTGK